MARQRDLDRRSALFLQLMSFSQSRSSSLSLSPENGTFWYLADCTLFGYLLWLAIQSYSIPSLVRASVVRGPSVVCGFYKQNFSSRFLLLEILANLPRNFV